MSLKKEFFLEIDEFNQTKSTEGLLALAKLIQNLILTEPGTYPNNPDLGIGISNYKFEFLDDSTINLIRSRIDSQISKFIPESQIDEILIQKANDSANTLGIMFTLQEPIDDENAFIVVLNQSNSSSETFSKIIV
jgi:phage baseplate assembly protein W